MNQIFIVRWVVTDGELAHVKRLLPELAEKSSAEVGVLFFTIYQSASDPHVFFLHERYADPEAVEAHRNSEHYLRIVVSEIRPRLASREVTEVRQFA